MQPLASVLLQPDPSPDEQRDSIRNAASQRRRGGKGHRQREERQESRTEDKNSECVSPPRRLRRCQVEGGGRGAGSCPFSRWNREQVWSQSLLKFTKGVEVKRVWDTATSLMSPPEGAMLSVISGYAPRGRT